MTDRPTHSADPPADAEPIEEPTAAPAATDPAVRTPAPGSRILPSRMARAARASEPPPAPVADAGSARTRVEEFREVFAALRAEIGKVIVGQADVVEEILIAFFAGGHVLIEGVPGHRQDADRALARRGAEPELQPHPVHRRPDAGRHHRHAHHHRSSDGRREFVFVAGSDLRARLARRRDQPRHAEDAVGAARGDGRAAGDGRRHDATGWRRRSSCSPR